MSFSPEYKKQLEREAAERGLKERAREPRRDASTVVDGEGSSDEAGSPSPRHIESPRDRRSAPSVAGGPPEGEGAISFSETFAEVAAEVGVSERTVRRWASGESRPSPLAMKALKERGWM